MAAAGIPVPRPDHAPALAWSRWTCSRSCSASGRWGDQGLELRIGINSGPVVAGVIGRKRFLYDLWGDAVNIADGCSRTARPAASRSRGRPTSC